MDESRCSPPQDLNAELYSLEFGMNYPVHTLILMSDSLSIVRSKKVLQIQPSEQA